MLDFTIRLAQILGALMLAYGVMVILAYASYLVSGFFRRTPPETEEGAESEGGATAAFGEVVDHRPVSPERAPASAEFLDPVDRGAAEQVGQDAHRTPTVQRDALEHANAVS